MRANRCVCAYKIGVHCVPETASGLSLLDGDVTATDGCVDDDATATDGCVLAEADPVARHSSKHSALVYEQCWNLNTVSRYSF